MEVGACEPNAGSRVYKSEKAPKMTYADAFSLTTAGIVKFYVIRGEREGDKRGKGGGACRVFLVFGVDSPPNWGFVRLDFHFTCF